MPAMFDPFGLYRERHHEMVDLGARQMARVPLCKWCIWLDQHPDRPRLGCVYKVL